MLKETTDERIHQPIGCKKQGGNENQHRYSLIDQHYNLQCPVQNGLGSLGKIQNGSTYAALVGGSGILHYIPGL
jgi:hypothetical protein